MRAKGMDFREFKYFAHFPPGMKFGARDEFNLFRDGGTGGRIYWRPTPPRGQKIRNSTVAAGPSQGPGRAASSAADAHLFFGVHHVDLHRIALHGVGCHP